MLIRSKLSREPQSKQKYLDSRFHSFNRYLLNILYVQLTVLKARDTQKEKEKLDLFCVTFILFLIV